MSGGSLFSENRRHGHGHDKSVYFCFFIPSIIIFPIKLPQTERQRFAAAKSGNGDASDRRQGSHPYFKRRFFCLYVLFFIISFTATSNYGTFVFICCFLLHQSPLLQTTVLLFLCIVFYYINHRYFKHHIIFYQSPLYIYQSLLLQTTDFPYITVGTTLPNQFYSNKV